MKKNLLLTIISVAFTTISWGQIHIISLATHHNVNDSTVKCYGNTVNQMSIDFNVYNADAVNLNSVYARRDSVKLPCPDTDNCFCWGGFCYSNTVTISSLDETIDKGDTASGLNSLQCHYDPDGFVGSWSVKYTVYNSVAPKDSAWVIVKYIVSPAGVQDISGGTVSFSAYPNPATNSVNFNYNFSNGVQAANLKIFNLLGECVQTIPLNTSKSKTTLDVQSMPAGIYVCEMEADGCQPTYQKLIVSH